MNDPTLPLPSLSPVSGKTVVAKFDGGLLSSNGGVLLLREVEQRLHVAERLAGCLRDPRDQNLVTQGLADIIRFRLLMIGAGYEDGNDAGALRSDPVFKMAQGFAPSDRELASQSTISRLENLPDARALLRMGRALVDLYCESFGQVPERITLDIDDTFDAVHGGQQLRLFNAHHDEYASKTGSDRSQSNREPIRARPGCATPTSSAGASATVAPYDQTGGQFERRLTSAHA
jgi:hypothetical protein